MAESRGIQPLASVWLAPRTEPVRKAAPAGLDRGRIVTAAIRLLDAEGLAKFSMRRLAAELGVSAMSVYWYVDNKDDLLELVLDAVSGEVDLPDPDRAGAEGAGAEGAGAGAADWRDDLRHIAAECRRVLVAHPWAPRLMGEYLNIGPHAMELASVAQRVMAGTGLPRELVPGALSAVFQFVYGFGTVEGRWAGRCREAGMSQDEFYRSVVDRVRGKPEFRGQLDLTERRDAAGVAELRDRDFAFALDCVIAGIEVMSGRRSKG